MFPDTVIKFSRQTADHRLVAGISEAQSPTRKPPQMRLWTNNDDGLSHSFGLHGRDHPRTRSTVDDDVEIRPFLLRFRREKHVTGYREREHSDHHPRETVTDAKHHVMLHAEGTDLANRKGS